MGSSILELGSKVIVLKDTVKDKNEYVSQIINVDEEYIRIMTPMFKSALIKLHDGFNINLTVFSGGKVYRFDAKVVRNVTEGFLHYVDILPTSEIKKIERRDHFRIEIIKDILVGKRVRRDEDVEYIKATAVDLSGGGIQISTEEKFEIEDEIKIQIEIDGEHIALSGKVVNINIQEQLGMFKYGVKFNNVERMIQEKIVSYVFKTQREQLKNRMV